MLSGDLPTGTVQDRSGDAERARPDRPDRTGGSAPGGATDATHARSEADDLRRENRRLRRRLAAERTERRAVVDRYERLLAERTAEAGGEATCGESGFGDRAAARVRRALTRLRCWSARFRSRRG